MRAEYSQKNQPRTLIFCTAFAVCHDVWTTRYRRWLEGIRRAGLEYDQILLVDDGSAAPPPSRFDCAVVPADGRWLPGSPVVMARFDTHLGKRQGTGYSASHGWYRSFGYAARYAAAGHFDKIIHVESDTFVLSRRLTVFINQLSAGWSTLWCPCHGFPEDNIQVIAGDRIRTCIDFFNQSYLEFSGAPIEKQYPFDNVEKEFIGDRYGEYRLDVPREADYVAQVIGYPASPENYFWWLAKGPNIRQATRSQYLGAFSTPEDVECAYNLFLFRDAEDRATILEKLGVSLSVLIGTLIASSEFRESVLPTILNRRHIEFRGSKTIDILKGWLCRVLSWDAESRLRMLATTMTADLLLEVLRNPEIVPLRQ
jgi:hypothetical protein